MRLICCLTSIATRRLGTSRRDQGDWTAHPVLVGFGSNAVYFTNCYLQLEPRQSNAHDCSIWVLAQIAAILRGYDVTSIKEDDIPHFRHFLRTLIHRLTEPA